MENGFSFPNKTRHISSRSLSRGRLVPGLICVVDGANRSYTPLLVTASCVKLGCPLLMSSRGCSLDMTYDEVEAELLDKS
jgi:hypothetical protein